MINNDIMDLPKIHGITCDNFGEQYTKGILLNEYPLIITYRNTSAQDAWRNWHTPSAILYSSDDGLIDMYKPEEDENYISPNGYRLYSTTRSDAFGIKGEALEYQYETQHSADWKSWDSWLNINKEGTICTATAVRNKQYVMVRMENASLVVISKITLPADAADDVYISLTCEKASLTDFSVIREAEAIEEAAIAPVVMKKPKMPVSEGDIPNIDCSGWWTAHSQGIDITEKPVYITYDSISYSQAKEKWHAPLIVLFSSLNKMVGGPAYREFCVIRSDAYGWLENGEGFTCQTTLPDGWTSWRNWLEANKKGVKCSVMAVRRDNKVIVTLENNGLVGTAKINIPYDVDLPVCLAISGELCSISNIMIEQLFSRKK